MIRWYMKKRYFIWFRNWNMFQSHSFDVIMKVYNERKNNISILLQRNKTWWKKFVKEFTNNYDLKTF